MNFSKLLRKNINKRINSVEKNYELHLQLY